jgi:hypothetical protein
MTDGEIRRAFQARARERHHLEQHPLATLYHCEACLIAEAVHTARACGITEDTFPRTAHTRALEANSHE